MTVINISDIIKDIEDIENHIDATEEEKKAIRNTIYYYPMRLCNDKVKRFLRIKDKQFKNLDYLIRYNFPLRNKFFSARNENILYVLDEYKAFYEIGFYISHDGILKFVNDTGKDDILSVRIIGGAVGDIVIDIEYKGKNQLDRLNSYRISLINNSIYEAFVATLKSGVSEFALIGKNQ